MVLEQEIRLVDFSFNKYKKCFTSQQRKVKQTGTVVNFKQ